MQMMGKMFTKPKQYQAVGKIARWSLRNLPQSVINSKLNTWGKARDLPKGPKQSFDQWYEERQQNKKSN